MEMLNHSSMNGVTIITISRGEQRMKQSGGFISLPLTTKIQMQLRKWGQTPPYQSALWMLSAVKSSVTRWRKEQASLPPADLEATKQKC